MTTQINDPARRRKGTLGLIHAYTEEQVAGLTVEPGQQDEDGDFLQCQVLVSAEGYHAPVVLIVDVSLGLEEIRRLVGKVAADLEDAHGWFEGALQYAQPKTVIELMAGTAVPKESGTDGAM